MTKKNIEDFFFNYTKDNYEYHRKENALKEIENIEEKTNLCISNIKSIVYDYPDYDHLAFNIFNKTFFIKLGFSREYLLTLSEKEIRKIAKKLYRMLLSIKAGGLE